MKISLDIGNNPKLWEKFLNFFVRQCLVRTSIQGNSLPPLDHSGITYQRETGEYWQTPEETNELGFGDCEDLSIYRACELRRAGISARVRIRRVGNHAYHAVVEILPGIYEDPSAMRGMRGRIYGVLSGDDTATPSNVAPTAFFQPTGAMMPGMMPGAPGMPGMMPGMNPLMLNPYSAAAMMAAPIVLPAAQQGVKNLRAWWKRRKQRRRHDG